MTFPVLVINLKRSADRRQAIREKLAVLGIAPVFIEGVDGSGFDVPTHPAYAPTRRLLFIGHHMTPGELGCLLSHRKVCDYIVENKIPAALVLEDDAILSPDLPEVLAALVARAGEWDLVRFLEEEKTFRKSRVVSALTPRHTLNRIKGTPGGAYGYVLNTRAAARLSEMMAGKNFLPGDVLQGHIWRTGLKTLSVWPSPVSPDRETPSCIGDVRFDKSRTLRSWQKPLFPLTRLAWKMHELICKNLFFRLPMR